MKRIGEHVTMQAVLDFKQTSCVYIAMGEYISQWLWNGTTWHTLPSNTNHTLQCVCVKIHVRRHGRCKSMAGETMEAG